MAWAGKLFADLGADVVRLEAGEDLVRARPHDIHIWLNTSKRAIDDEPATRRALIAGADILLHGLGPARAEAEQLAFAELLAIAPRLVVCSITPWGMTGPYANYEAEELTVIHGSSWGYLSPGGATRVDLPPLKGPGHHATLNVATIAAEWFASRLVREVFHAGQRVGVCLNPVNPVSALADDEHLRARGFLARSPGGQLLPGSGARLEPAGWALRRDAPAPGQHNGESWLPRDDRRAQVAGAGPAGRLLEGVRVLDFTWVWAGPFCTQYLAHLGADVLRVESPGRADIFRRMPFTPKGIKRTLDTSGPFQVYNSDKRSVAMDLGHPDARGLVLRMVERCDVVVENFSVGTMAQLGLGVDDLRAVNPAVIVASLTGFGQTGPYAGYTAYGPAGGAMTGLFAANGYADGDVAETGIAVGDPGLGIAAAWSIVAALVSRRRGEGQPASMPPWWRLSRRRWASCGWNTSRPVRTRPAEGTTTRLGRRIAATRPQAKTGG